jgi:cadmium resistance protein CadD (predicted permease)
MPVTQDTKILTEEQMGNRIVTALGILVALVIAFWAVGVVYGLLHGLLPVILGIAVGAGAMKVKQSVDRVVPKETKVPKRKAA